MLTARTAVSTLVGRVDGAVRDLVDLVQLLVDPIHAASDLVDHGQDLLLRSL